MKRIVFRNGLPPALNDTNLNTLQDNVEDVFNGVDAMGDIQTSSITNSGNATIGGNLSVSDHIINKTMSSTNLNDAITNGTYSYDNGQTVHSNSPTNDGIHILNVYNNGGGDWVVQEDYDLRYGSGAVDKYVRLKTPGGWGNWQKII